MRSIPLRLQRRYRTRPSGSSCSVGIVAAPQAHLPGAASLHPVAGRSTGMVLWSRRHGNSFVEALRAAEDRMVGDLYT